MFVYIYPLGGEEIVIILFVSQLIMSHNSVFVALHSVYLLYTGRVSVINEAMSTARLSSDAAMKTSAGGSGPFCQPLP